MKRFSKLIIGMLMCILLVGIFTVAVSAKTYTGTKYGYHSDYIYVHTTKANAQIPMTFTKGIINTDEDMYNFYGNGTGNIDKSKYASYEVKISYWDGSKYVMESNYDIYDKASHTITLKKANKDYKIQIYQWKVKTTLDSYIKKGKVAVNTFSYSIASPFWRVLPKYSTGTLKYCTQYSKNPH